MNENVQSQELGDNKINIWELIEHLKSGWRWLVSSSAAGLFGAIGFLILMPAKYEALALIQPATIGMAPVMTVESVAQTLERMKLVTFYNDEMVKACQVKSVKDLAEGVKSGVVKNNTLLSVSYRANSADIAKLCVAKIVGQLTQIQSDISAPLIQELEGQLASTKRQIDDMERLLVLSDKTLSFPLNEAMFLVMKREELAKLQKLYREQRIQLTSPFTQPVKLLEPIYVSEKPVSPQKMLTVFGGLIGGLFVGLLAFLVNRGWHRHKSMSN